MPKGFDKGKEDADAHVKALNEKPKFARLCIYIFNCFGSLVESRNNLDYIIEINGFDAMLNTMEMHHKNSHVISESTIPFIKACRIPEYASHLGKIGGIDFCLRQLQRSKDSASNKNVVKMLKALTKGSDDNLHLFKEKNGVEILSKLLKDSLAEKNEELVAAILNLLDRVLDDTQILNSFPHDTVKSVVQSLKEYPKNPPLAISALSIINKLASASSEYIKLLKELDALKYISIAMDNNPTNNTITKLGNDALHKLGDESDLMKSIKAMNKYKDFIEYKNAIAMVGNLSSIKANHSLLEQQKILERLEKIMRPIVDKLNSASKEDLVILSTCARACGNLSNISSKTMAFYKKNIVSLFIKSLGQKSLNETLLMSIITSLDRFIVSDFGYDAVVSHKTLLPLLLSSVNKFPKSKEVLVAYAILNAHLSRKESGVQVLSSLKIFEFMDNTIRSNIANEPIVIENLESFIAIAEQCHLLSDEENLKMMNSALHTLKNSESRKCHKKALELLTKLAEKSPIVSKHLKMYENLSVLNKFYNETNDADLKAMIDRLKDILKRGPSQLVAAPADVLDLLKEIEENSSRITKTNAPSHKEILNFIYDPSEKLSSLSQETESIAKLKKNDGLARLQICFASIKESEQSNLRDDVLKNVLVAINALTTDSESIIYCLQRNPKYYSQLVTLFNSNVSNELKEEIKNSFILLEKSKMEYLTKAIQYEKANPGDSSSIILHFKNLCELSQVVDSLPSQLDLTSDQYVQDGIKFAVQTIQKNTENVPLVISALKFIDLLNAAKKHKTDFAKNYVASLCSIVKNNADNDDLGEAIMSFLASYENDPNCSKFIADLRNWQIDRMLETDLDALKLYLLDTVYEVMDDKTQKAKFNSTMQRLMYCYDSNNVLVQQAGSIASKSDDEVAKMLLYILSSDNYSKEMKILVSNLIAKMIQKSAIEKMFLQNKYIQKLIDLLKNAKTKEERDLLLRALAPFLLSENHVIKSMVSKHINELLLNSFTGSEEERNNLLDSIISNLNDGDKSLLISSECLQTLLQMLEMQKTVEGKSKVITLISKMTANSESIAKQIVQGSGLAIILKHLEREIESAIFVEKVTEFTVNLAHCDSAIPAMSKAKVDHKMKDIMFKYSDNKEIFHNAQRTIDLMTLKRLNLTPEELKKWKSRSRIKQLMTELCRGLGVMISSVLTRGEREVRTGDTSDDISKESLRILNEFGTSFDDAIESDSSTKVLTWLGEAWLLRAVLMAYTFLVEKDASARSFVNAPTKIEESLVHKCGFTAMWDYENTDFDKMNHYINVRGGIGHRSVRLMIDSSIDPKPCQEIDLITKAQVGREYTLEDLIIWVKMDDDERDTLRCFNLILSWVTTNWNLVTITASIIANTKKGVLDEAMSFLDGAFISIRCALNWEWDKYIDQETFYFKLKDAPDPYTIIEPIKKTNAKKGLHIKVKISGEELRNKRREIKDQLDFSFSNVLTGDEKDELDYFIDFSANGMECQRHFRQMMRQKVELVNIKFGQAEDGDLYFSWVGVGQSESNRVRLNVKEFEGIVPGKTTKSLSKAKSVEESECFSLLIAGDKDFNFSLSSQNDRDIWVNGLKLVICTVIGRKPSEMVW